MARPRLPAGARVLLALVIAAAAFALFAYQDALATRAAVGRPAPAFSLPAAGGRAVPLVSLRGQPVVLNFWASWCTVCIQEAPALEAFAKRYAGTVEVVGVDWREPWSALTAYTARTGLTFLNLRDADGSVAQRYGLTGVPETWFIDARGVATGHIVGAATFEQLAAGSVGAPQVPASGLLWDGSRVWVATAAGLFSSTDRGRTWRRMLNGDFRFVVAAGDGTLVAGGPAAGLWQARAGAGSWRADHTLPGRPSAVAAAGRTLWAWVAGVGLLRSTDGARTWSAAGPADGLPAAASALAAAGTRIYAGTPAGAYTSNDSGRTWTAVPLTEPVSSSAELSSPAAVVTGRAPLAAAGIAVWRGAVYFAGPSGIWRLRGGAGGRLPASPPRAFSALASGPGGGLWALAPDGDLYRAAASGNEWTWQPYSGKWAPTRTPARTA